MCKVAYKCNKPHRRSCAYKVHGRTDMVIPIYPQTLLAGGILNTCWKSLVDIYGTIWSEYIINICWELLFDIYITIWSEYIINTCWKLLVDIYGTIWSKYIIHTCWELLIDIYVKMSSISVHIDSLKKKKIYIIKVLSFNDVNMGFLTSKNCYPQRPR